MRIDNLQPSVDSRLYLMREIRVGEKIKKATAAGSMIAFLAIAPASKAVAEVGLDPTCTVISDAYLATRSSPNYSAKVFGRKEGLLLGDHDYRVTPDAKYRRDGGRGEWHKEARKPVPPLSYSSGPRFSACKPVDDKSALTPGGVYFTAKWAVVPYTADASIWLTADGKRMKKVKLRYHSSYMRPQPYPEIVEVFSYDNP